MYYNFVRIHQTLRCTPAMAAGVTDRLWDMSDVVALLDEREKEQKSERRDNQLSTKGSALGYDPIPRN